MRLKAIILLVLYLIVSTLPARTASGTSSNIENDTVVRTITSVDDEPEYDSEVRVHKAGLLWLTISNRGICAAKNMLNLKDPCTGTTAINSELPGGSGIEYLFSNALWVGGYKDSVQVEGAIRFQGPLVSTGTEGWTAVDGNTQFEMWPSHYDESAPYYSSDQHKITETSIVEGRINCLFEDVYDVRATAEEQFNTVFTDKLANPGKTGRDDISKRNHIPLGIEVRQRSYAWSYDYAKKFVVFDYTFYNRNDSSAVSGGSIWNMFVGLFSDYDVGSTGGNVTEFSGDDIAGFVHAANIFNPETGQFESRRLSMMWVADNDGRNYTGSGGNGGVATPINEPGAGEPLDGATGVASVRVLRNPNKNLRYSYNSYIANTDDETLDWGPRWETGLHSAGSVNGVEGKPWQYDLTYTQKGYDDVDYNSLGYLGGMTEGRPLTDVGRYMVMSNEEFDYASYQLANVNAEVLELNGNTNFDPYVDPEYIEDEYKQAEKWKKWNVVEDGSIDKLLNLNNGGDVKNVLSFGPLGDETEKTVLTKNGPVSKTVWEFKSGDSIKLTLAYIVNEDFYTNLDYDPVHNEEQLNEVGLSTDNQYINWDDAFTNVVWAERVYDIPMHDTRVIAEGSLDTTKFGDGWYGEDVGKDLIFGKNNGDECFWMSANYVEPDEGERNNELDDVPEQFVEGELVTSEDNLLKFGNTQERTITLAGGDEVIIKPSTTHGYMVKDPEGGPDVRYGYNDGRLNVGDGVPDFTGPPPPPSPKIQVKYENKDIIIEWKSKEITVNDDGSTSIGGPEIVKDSFTGVNDFEGYQVWVSPIEEESGFVEIFGVDKDNYIYENIYLPGSYLDIPFTDHPDSTEFKIVNNKRYQKVPFGSNNSIYESHSEGDLFTYSATKDFYTNNQGEQDSLWVYRFVFKNQLYADKKYIAVTASDHGEPKSGTPPLKSSPTQNRELVILSKVTGTDDVYVVPNPYRVDANYEEMGWEDSKDWDEHDRRLTFFNIPQKAVIRIYTLSGDLVKTITHNASSRSAEAVNAVDWNLINDNAQTVTSGVYLFSVKDAEDDGFDYVGKFVIIK